MRRFGHVIALGLAHPRAAQRPTSGHAARGCATTDLRSPANSGRLPEFAFHPRHVSPTARFSHGTFHPRQVSPTAHLPIRAVGASMHPPRAASERRVQSPPHANHAERHDSSQALRLSSIPMPTRHAAPARYAGLHAPPPVVSPIRYGGPRTHPHRARAPRLTAGRA
ncbi:hypothetical protein GLE_4315 [Lysobacter enzymogenes]|uniref:Uncharacterized protein n=1 Tax=Lysobacter enzymogenes TaxID=69 RepID=A0A0S2DNF4_LYSEN|nr:hypothetical protein GLE_4315 [Lysobacter enzymogenes]